jgi:multicomponent Na+:H+ antiporter subunit D
VPARGAGSAWLPPNAVLSGAARIPPVRVSFSYFSPEELFTVAITAALGTALAWVYVRIGEPAPITLLRRLHTGSVNDYAVFGVLCTLAVLVT